MKRILIILFLYGAPCLLAGKSSTLHNAEDPFFFKITAERGDGMYTLFRKYKLDPTSCNIQKFLELNKLELNQNLMEGRSYQLPILIYNYDGISIRSSIGDTDFEKAKRIQLYNEYILAQGLRKTHYVDSRVLWVPYNEIYCEEGREKSTEIQDKKTGIEDNSGKKDIKGYVNEPLFGESFAKVPIEDYTLKDKVFYVISGHGGPDPGAICTNAPKMMCEDEYAYDVALRLARNLMQHGATVHVIIQDKNDGIRTEKYLECDTDEKTITGKTLPINQKKRLKQRVDIVNELYAKHKKEGKKDQVMISIHVDSRSTGTRQDVFFYHSEGSKSGKKTAELLHKTFDKKYELFQKGRGYKGFVEPRPLYVLKYSHPTAVFVEMANIKNLNDHQRLILDTNRQAIANWLFEGLRDSVLK